MNKYLQHHGILGQRCDMPLIFLNSSKSLGKMTSVRKGKDVVDEYIKRYSKK